jgi:hypothetical protein
VNFNYFVGYYSSNLGPNLSPDASVMEAGLFAAYDKAIIDAGWWDDWETRKGLCASSYNRIAYDTSKTSIGMGKMDKNQYSISCSPNPNINHRLLIKYYLPENKKIKIELINSSGFVQALMENESIRTKGQYENEFDISSYPCGLYFVRMISGGEIITTGKFLKR